MDWIIENKEWIFSGIGIFILGFLFTLIKTYQDIAIKNIFNGYYFPISLSYFCYGSPSNGKIPHISRRILSVCALRNKKISIKWPVYSAGSIESGVSLSDPGRMKMIKSSDHEGKYNLEIVAEKGCHYLVISETKINISLNESKTPSEHNKVLYTLFTKRNFTNKNSFSGTRIIGKTDTVRIIIEFSGSIKPIRVNPIQIDSSGKIIRDEKNKDFVIAEHLNETYFVMDLRKPKEGSGIYLWWEWQNFDAEPSHLS